MTVRITITASVFDPSQHPRQPSGAAGGGQFAPAGGAGKDAQGKTAQQDKTAQANLLKLGGLPADDAAKFLRSLSQKDLEGLTALAYSAHTSDSKVVHSRVLVANEMSHRGLDIQKHGALGGGVRENAKSKPKITTGKKT